MIKELIDRLQLQKHPEGGYFKELYRSADSIKPPARFNAEKRSCATGIYFLLETRNNQIRLQELYCNPRYERGHLRTHTWHIISMTFLRNNQIYRCLIYICYI